MPSVARKLKTLIDVGLSYIRLGQAATTLSGGEGGGQIIAVGTPEQVAKNKASHTGKYLKPVLKRG